MPGEIRFTAVRFEGREQVETQQVGRRVSETSAAPQAKTTCRCVRGKKCRLDFVFRGTWRLEFVPHLSLNATFAMVSQFLANRRGRD